jgi:hypothetical protein
MCIVPTPGGGMVGAAVFSLPRNFALATGVHGALIAWAIGGAGMLMLAFVFQARASIQRSRSMTYSIGSAAFATIAISLSAAFSVRAATVRTGDMINGIPVISRLDISDLDAGKKHEFYFRGVQMGTGQDWYVPIVVAKGAKAGKRIVLVAGVHGDEVSPVDAVQRTMAQLDPATMSGTVFAVYDTGAAGQGVCTAQVAVGTARRYADRHEPGLAR